MQRYLKDGHEILEIEFDASEIKAYNQLFGIQPLTQVAPLFCAKLWLEFQLFQPFRYKNLILRETEVQQLQTLYINEQYHAHLYFLNQSQVRKFMKYTFKLEINKNREKCITIIQVFLEEI